MKFGQLGIGIVLVLAVFCLEWFLHLSSISYLLISIYIVRYKGSHKNLFILGLVSTAAVIIGYFVSSDGTFVGANVVSHLLSLSVICLCVYFNDRFRKDAIRNDAVIRSLHAQKNEAISELKSANATLELISVERAKAEKELLKRKSPEQAGADAELLEPVRSQHR